MRERADARQRHETDDQPRHADWRLPAGNQDQDQSDELRADQAISAHEIRRQKIRAVRLDHRQRMMSQRGRHLHGRRRLDLRSRGCAMSIEITEWLRALGLEQYEQVFRANDVDAEVLPKLTAEDLISIGVNSVGHRRKLLQAITALGAEAATLTPAHSEAA